APARGNGATETTRNSIEQAIDVGAVHGRVHSPSPNSSPSNSPAPGPRCTAAVIARPRGSSRVRSRRRAHSDLRTPALPRSGARSTRPHPTSRARATRHQRSDILVAGGVASRSPSRTHARPSSATAASQSLYGAPPNLRCAPYRPARNATTTSDPGLADALGAHDDVPAQRLGVE